MIGDYFLKLNFGQEKAKLANKIVSKQQLSENVFKYILYHGGGNGRSLRYDGRAGR